jgi:molybdopterin-guanine dinucleotide biosynthesis protein B
MKRLHVVGRKNHGKTRLIVELVEELKRRGLNVGTIKRTPHRHELDSPGKDSHLHRRAGGDPAAIVTPELIALFSPRSGNSDPYAALAPLYRGCDLALVEGDIDAEAPKIEVWRAELATPPLATQGVRIEAVVSDDRPQVNVPIWPRRDVAAIVDRILELMDRV